MELPSDEYGTTEFRSSAQTELVELLNRCAEAYSLLSGRGFPSAATRIVLPGALDDEFFDSLSVTVASLSLLVKAGAISDAYTLMRRFSELSKIHICLMLELSKPINTDDRTEDGLLDLTDEGRSELYDNFICKLDSFTFISDWIADLGGWKKKKRPDISLSCQAVKAVYSALDKEQYKLAYDRCNDYVHINHYSNLLISAQRISSELWEPLFKTLKEDFLTLFIYHVALAFAIVPFYMASSDYADYRECELEPPEGSQHWVANFVQELFGTVIKVHSPEVARILKELTYMDLA